MILVFSVVKLSEMFHRNFFVLGGFLKKKKFGKM